MKSPGRVYHLAGVFYGIFSNLLLSFVVILESRSPGSVVINKKETSYKFIPLQILAHLE